MGEEDWELKDASIHTVITYRKEDAAKTDVMGLIGARHPDLNSRSAKTLNLHNLSLRRRRSHTTVQTWAGGEWKISALYLCDCHRETDS